MIKLIPKGQEHYRIARLGVLGIKIVYGEILMDDDGVWLRIPEGTQPFKAGMKYTIRLPHDITIVRNLGFVSAHPDIVDSMEYITFPTLLPTGWQGVITVSFKPKEALTLDKIIKISVLEIAY